MNAQVNNSRLPGGCFDVGVPLPERQIEDTDAEVVSATTICEAIMGGVSEMTKRADICAMK